MATARIVAVNYMQAPSGTFVLPASLESLIEIAGKLIRASVGEMVAQITGLVEQSRDRTRMSPFRGSLEIDTGETPFVEASRGVRAAFRPLAET